MSANRTERLRVDTVGAVAVSISYSIAKVGHALDGRAGIPGGPTITAAQAADGGDVASAQWILVALGVLAAAIALSSCVRTSQRGVAFIRWIAVTAAASLASIGAGVIVIALFEATHPLRWSQPIGAAMSVVGAVSWLHLAVRSRPRR